VEDSVSLAEITAISADFGVAESHPTFTREPTGEQLRLLVTRRPADSRVSDVLSADGTDRRVIAEDSGGRFTMGHPSYSPDGRFVAYHRSTCDRQAPPVSLPAVPGCLVEGSEIVVAAADGSDPVVVEPATQPRPEGARDINPAWSPDGTAVAFTRIEPPAASGGPEAPSTRAIWVARGLDLAAEPADLVADSVAQLTTPNRAVIEDGEVDELDDEAAWSPDSSRVAFTRARFDTGIFDGEPRPLDAGSYDSDIWVVDVSTGDEQPLLAAEVGADQDDELCPESPRTDAAGTVCAGGDDRGADWSPDGTKVVYEHTGWLYLADPDARTDLGPLTGPRVLDPSPSLPLYPDDPADPPVDATDPTSAAFPDLDWAQDPAWSPNGDRVAFAGQPRGHPDQRGIHWLTVPSDPADREIRQVAEQPQPEIEPDWQPTADLAITLTAVPASVEVGSQSQVTATITN
jgi:Tol biopolymer transport system component